MENISLLYATICHIRHSGLDGLIVSLPSNEQLLRIINFKLIFMSKNRKKQGDAVGELKIMIILGSGRPTSKFLIQDKIFPLISTQPLPLEVGF